MYHPARIFIRFVLRQFFARINVTGAKLVDFGPLLIVANHPNDLLDPLLVVGTYPRPAWFLAKSTLFSTPFIAAILRGMHLVPVFRRQDNVDVTKNDESFKFAADLISLGKAIVIFPEGASLGERRLGPLKTGAARIACQAEHLANFTLGLKIQPVGITYSQFKRFRSSVTVHVAEPITLIDWAAQYESNPREVVREITELISAKLREITIEVPLTGAAHLAERIGMLFQSLGVGRDEWSRLRIVARNLAQIESIDSATRDDIIQRVDRYFEHAAELGLDGDENLTPWVRRATWPMTLMALAISPLAILGAIICYPPYKLTGIYVSRMVRDPVEHGGAKLSAGVVLYTLWFGLLAFIVGLITHSILLAVLTYVELVLLAVVTNRTVWRLQIWLLWLFKPLSMAALRRERGQLIYDLQALRTV